MGSKLSERQQLVVFFCLAFAIGWLAFVPAMLFNFLPNIGAFVFLFSPAMAGLITAALAGGRAGAREVLGRYLVWKFPLRWYLLAVLLLPIIFLVGAGFALETKPATLWTGSPWYFVLASFGYLMFINSGEEIGWRGFALPHLQTMFRSRLAPAILLGLLWGLWHLPVYIDPRQSSSFPFALFMLFIIGLSIIYAVLYQQTGSSLLAAVLLHAGTDIAPRFIQIANFGPFSWSIIVILVWAAALVLYFMTHYSQKES